MYNKNLLDEAGVPIRWVNGGWDQFLEACQKLTKDTDGDGKIDQWGWLLPDLSGWTMDVPLTTNKASMYNAEGTKSTLDTPEKRLRQRSNGWPIYAMCTRWCRRQEKLAMSHSLKRGAPQ
ncbi:MAG: hypothetical protein R2932_54195 [Caldilineaceae bacterium]